MILFTVSSVNIINRSTKWYPYIEWEFYINLKSLLGFFLSIYSANIEHSKRYKIRSLVVFLANKMISSE